MVGAPLIACFALLLASALAAAATWIPPVDLGTPSEFSPWEPRPEIAMSGGGGGVAIWPQLEGLGSLEAASMSLMGTWGSPVELAANEWGQREKPQLAMNEAGEAVAVWEQFEQATVVAKVRTPLGEWGPPESLSPEGSLFTEPDVAVGPAGEAVAVWCEAPRFGSNREYRIESSFRPAGGHWEPAVTLSDPEHASYNPQVAIAPAGQIVAAWDGYLDEPHNTVQVSEGQGGLWSAPKAVSGSRNSAFPKVEVSNAGAAVVWQGEGGWIEAASRAAGGAWGSPVELSGPESFEPEIGADSDGTAVAIWSSFYGKEGDYVESSTLSVGANWSEPTAISGRVGLPEPDGARLAVAPNGQTLAAWSVWREPERFVEAALGLKGRWEAPTTLSAAGAWAVRPAVALDDQGDGAVAWWAANPTLPQATEFVTPRPGATSGGGEPVPSNSPSSSSLSSRSKRGRATVARIALVRKGKAYLELRCPGASACKGDLRLVAPPTGKNGKATRLTARSVTFAILAGRAKTIAVRLNRKGEHLFSAAGKKGIHVRVVGDQIQQRGLLLRRATGQ